MHQDFILNPILNPILDGFSVRDVTKVLVQATEFVYTLADIAGPLGIVIKDDLALDLVNPDVRAHVVFILVPGVKGDFLEDLVFHILDEVYQCSHNRIKL